MLIDCYRQSYFQNNGIALSSVRGGNVIGGGDWSDNRIIPDLIRAWLANRPVNLRYPNAIRPWQHVLETVHAYTSIAQNIYVNPNTDGEFNIGPNIAEVLTVGNVAGLAAKLLDNLQVIVDRSYSGPKETSRLTLDNSKVNEVHGIAPVWHAEEAICKTINWYKNFSDGIDARDLCYSDIESFSVVGQKMQTEELPISGVYRVQRNKSVDSRGFFSRFFCARELSKVGWTNSISQINHTFTKNLGTVRGMHFQKYECSEAKFVSCLKGEIFDVALDLRPDSPSYLHWHGEILSETNGLSLLIPKGVAHGFQSLSEGVEMLYLHDNFYEPAAEDGIHPLDPSVGIRWPLEVTMLSSRDSSFNFLSG